MIKARKLKVIPPEAQVIKLKRTIKEISEIKVREFNAKLNLADYDVWVEENRRAISEINARIRASNR